MEQESRDEHPVGRPLPRQSSPPNKESGNTLFIDSTISQDDTVGDVSKKREMLAKFSKNPERSGSLLIASRKFHTDPSTGAQDSDLEAAAGIMKPGLSVAGYSVRFETRPVHTLTSL
jgi:hypothetical protein